MWERFAGRAVALEPIIAVALGSYVRLFFVLRQGFPLNDGGLFYLMTQELQRARYLLPATTSYNGAHIPFAYPPLGFYLAGLLDSLGPWSLLDVFRFLPVAASIATIVAFHRLACLVLRSRSAASVAVLAFSLLPRSFHWLVMGGGITRSPGFLLAILTVEQAYLLYARGARRHVLLAAVLAACTALAHLEMALFAACSMVLLFLAYGRSRAALRDSLLVAAGALALSSPWWAVVVARHGVAPFLAVCDHGWSVLGGAASVLLFLLTEEAHFPILASLSLLGALTCLARRRLLLLPAWVTLLFVLDPRSAHTTATIPLALLAGIGVIEQLVPAVERIALAATEGGRAAGLGHGPRDAGGARGAFAGVVIACAFIYALVSVLTPEWALLTALSPDERSAMRWVSEHTPPESTFLVLTADAWPVDRSSEWFPVLAERVSAGTAQGSEWLGGFSRSIRRSTSLQSCASQDVECLETWMLAHGAQVTHVYVAKRPPITRSDEQLELCCDGLDKALRRYPRYQIVYDGEGAAVFARKPGAAAGDGGEGDG